MKEHLILLCFFLFLIATPITGEAQSIPTSSRSKEVISKFSPKIHRELSKVNSDWSASIFIRIFKEEMALEIWLENESGFQLFKSYAVCIYVYGTLGPKTMEGDGQAPEGFYFVAPARMNPVDNFHLSFRNNRNSQRAWKPMMMDYSFSKRR